MGVAQRRQRSACSTAGITAILRKVDAGSDGAGAATGASREAPGNQLLEEPDQQKDDDDERQKSATDVHTSLPFVCLPGDNDRMREVDTGRLGWPFAATWPSG